MLAPAYALFRMSAHMSIHTMHMSTHVYTCLYYIVMAYIIMATNTFARHARLPPAPPLFFFRQRHELLCASRGCPFTQHRSLGVLCLYGPHNWPDAGHGTLSHIHTHVYTFLSTFLSTCLYMSVSMSVHMPLTVRTPVHMYTNVATFSTFG